MASVIRPLFHTSVAEGVYTEIVSRMSKYYYGTGFILPWDENDTPVAPSNTFNYEITARRELLAAHFISAGDVSFVVRRIDWTSGVVYDQYDDSYSATNLASSGASSLKTANFYVLTDDFNVYKCISNDYGKASVNKPSGTGTSIFSTADGYQWKFMYTIPLSLRNKFLNSDFIPVTRSVLNGFYSNGAITNVTIDNPGSGYSAGNTTLSISGDGTDAEVELTINGSGQIESATIVDAGNGYTFLTATVVGAGTGGEVSLTVSEGDLNTQQANVELLAIDGAIHKIQVTGEGSGYTENATVTITGDGSGATATPVIEGGKVVDIVVTNPGTNYRTATVTIQDNNGTSAAARAIISPLGGHGKHAVHELLADTLCFNISLDNLEYNGVAINNDSRQLCILKDIEEYDSNAFYSGVNGTAAFTLEGVFDESEHASDDIITSGDKTLYVVSSTDNKLLAIARDDSVPSVGETYTNSSNSNAFSVTAVTNPDVNKYSGVMAFLDNRDAFNQTEDQFVNFKTFIKF